MKYALKILLVFTLFISFVGCAQTPKQIDKPVINKIQDVQIFTSKNTNNTLSAKSIEAAFESVGLSVLGNNDMNKPFQARFGRTYYMHYNLAMYINNDLSYKLIKKYPQFGALTPLTMSIYTTDKSINIATLTRNGISRAANIPLNDPDLIAYTALIHKALKKALPNGKFKNIPSQKADINQSYQVNFISDTNKEDDISWDDYIEDFEAEFEAEMEPYGFLFPNFINIQEELFDEHDYHKYDFYHTYSICKFDVIFPVSKLHPEAGAWAPCSFYIYKLKNENKMHMGFLGVQNWITTLDIKDKESIQPLTQAQEMIKKILKELTN